MITIFPVGRADPGVEADQGYAEQVGRVHGVLAPRLHLRQEPQPPQQPPGGSWCYQAEGAHAGPQQLYVRYAPKYFWNDITIIFTITGRRSLQGSGMNIESDKHVQVTLPDHQVQQLLFYQFYNFCFLRL